MQAPTQNAQTGTTYTAALLDAGKTVTLSNAAAVTLTIPAQATVAWVDNTRLNFLNLGAGTVTIAAGAGVTINGTPLTLATSKGGSLVRTASNVWTFESSGGGTSASGTATVATSQTTTSTSFVDLGTVGPAVTITTGTKALVTVSCNSNSPTATWGAYMGFAVSGASTVAANLNDCIQSSVTSRAIQFSFTKLVTGLTAGSNTFTAKYASQGGGNNATFYNRQIIVIDMGS